MRFRRFSLDSTKRSLALDFRDKDVIGIVGGNDSGKTVALNALAGAYFEGDSGLLASFTYWGIHTFSVDISVGNDLKTARWVGNIQEPRNGGEFVMKTGVRNKSISEWDKNGLTNGLLFYTSDRKNLAASIGEAGVGIRTVYPVVSDLLGQKIKDSVILVDDVSQGLGPAETLAFINFLMKKALNSGCQLIMTDCRESFGMLPLENVLRLEGGVNPVAEATKRLNDYNKMMKG